MTTKIGLIADVHADVTSLRAALDLLTKIDVDEVLCAGDLVEKGPDGDLVVKMLKAEGVPTVMGNHDHYVVTHLASLLDVQGHPEHSLTTDTIEYLNKLPSYVKLEREGKRIFLAHGTPYDKYEYLFLNSPDDLYQLVVEETDLSDVVILGHTHAPMIVRVEDTTIVNPGSVCGTLSFGSATCAVLTLPDGNFDVYSIETGEPVHAERRLVEDII